jgi:very-short-patch-repair endonuclease
MSFAPEQSYALISRIAGPQRGFVTRNQLRTAGLSTTAIDSLLRYGRLVPYLYGVYAVGHIPTQPEARAFGAQLAVGDHGALAGASACAHYGVYERWEEPFELICTENRRPSGVIVHQSRTLALRDVWRFDGLRVTAPARTALDIAPRMSDTQLKRAVNHLRLRRRDRLALDQLADVLLRNPRHPGTPALSQLFHAAGPRPTRSDFEREFPAFARRFGLPPFALNALLGGVEVDVLFLPARLIVELDTFATHLLNFASDRRRDAEFLARFGIPTIRLTWEAFRDEPERQAELILAALARR